nr:hypothetical protein [uncultured Campylobacter sp.]
MTIAKSEISSPELNSSFSYFTDAVGTLRPLLNLAWSSLNLQ